MGIEESFSAWSQGEMTDAEFQEALEQALRSVEEHREGYQRTLSSLSESELEACGDLPHYCLNLIDGLDSLLLDSSALVEAGTRAGVLSLGDKVARSGFQLRQALMEFKNRVLIARGPTNIPGLNLLHSLRSDYETAPSLAAKQRLLGAVQAEVAAAKAGLERFCGDSAEVVSLKNVFVEHIEHLNALSKVVVESSTVLPDLFGHLLQLNITYTELHRLVPLVESQLAAPAATPFPAFNQLLGLLEGVRERRIPEHLLLEMIETMEGSLQQLDEALQEVDFDEQTSEGVEGLDESLTAFFQGANKVYGFVEGRNVALLDEARAAFLTSAKALQQASKFENALSRLFDEGAPKERPIVTERLVGVYYAVDDLLLERIGVEQYQRVVASLEAHLATQTRKTRDASTREAFELMLAGVELLRRNPEDEAALRQGVSVLSKGAGRLQEALAAGPTVRTW